MLPGKINNYNILLASKSLRRQQLLKDSGIDFQVADNRDTDESYPENLGKCEIPLYLAERKSDAYADLIKDDLTIIITADTIVWLDGQILGKPQDRDEAIEILRKLSGKTHEVITGVALRSKRRMKSFHSHSEVSFAKLRDEEIRYYVDNFKPYDKAGAYGIQEWIGFIGIEFIKGSFYNVMGLPVHLLYRELEDFIDYEYHII